MIEWRRSPTHSLDGTLIASSVTTILAPLLAYAAAGSVEGYPFTGAATGLFVIPVFPFVAPLAFAFIFLCSGTLGWLLSFLRIRHIAFFALAGAVVGLLAWSLGPALIGLGKRAYFLPASSDAAKTLSVVVSMIGAGAVNGAIFWLVARRISRGKV